MIAQAPTLAATLLDEPHHDGSEAYVVDVPDERGGDATVRVRVPRASGVTAVALRYVRDGEARVVAAERDEEDAVASWWRASFPVTNPATRYRWLLAGRGWLNGTGLVRADPADADDFVLAPGAGGPEWHLSSAVYEVFLDRFARGGLQVEPPSWAVPKAWSDAPSGRGPETPREWFGGDLLGLERRLDHLDRLGVNVVYLTPFFPAGSTHRYDAASFDRVDPLLGGDAALASLLDVAHARGIRVVGDLTLNHCGVGHEWFEAAQAGPEAPERELFLFDETLANGYESWAGFASLPKFDWRSEELRRRALGVLRHWLDRGLDGWRIDAANVIGRHGDVDVNREVARAARAAAKDALLVAEHFHDFRADLPGDGWHGVMDYSGFLAPVWRWLQADDEAERWALPLPLTRSTGAEAVATMRTFRAGVPWQATLHSWLLLDSHDVARFRTVAGSRERQLVGVGLQLTTPGVPMLFAGDELGLEGEWGEDARRPMPWDDVAGWDVPLLQEYRRLVPLRRSSDALARGGIRYAHVGDDAIAYLRESPSERLLCLAVRAAHTPIRLPLDALACRELETLYGEPANVASGVAVLPADGPSFHVWRLTDG